ncbi:sensor histidine kinase [Glacieibacterium frigidum]|uniref:sensor histidine kinase n=1 Tax=Glacieibacterium frigidum TaxID=2593303 RepID=UPI00163D69FA|nr:histidine kinase dimerization/phosphoacceptor domain -containing protein [Glacieibacterium frigidum]
MRVRNWPLAAKVIAALTLTLLPLGIVAVLVAVRNYRAAGAALGRSDDIGMTLVQLLGITLPLLMWIAALAIGWVIASRLIVRPLTRMRRAVDRYTAGDASVRLGSQRFFSLEVEALADAFDGMAERIADYAVETEAAITEQQRLTREVHHRVKNNLQIVSSLLSLQAREAKSDDVAHAYAIIQARVAALAVVHRWMYESAVPGGAEGVDLRAMATDICAGLEQSVASTEHLPLRIHCEIASLYVGQDTAVPIAFVITELVSCAARLTTPAPLAVTIDIGMEGTGGVLGVAAPAFVGIDILALNSGDPASRIVHGMARQLRSPLRHDAAAGRYSISFPLVTQAA